MPTRQQEIIWTNDGKFTRHQCVDSVKRIFNGISFQVHRVNQVYDYYSKYIIVCDLQQQILQIFKTTYVKMTFILDLSNSKGGLSQFLVWCMVGISADILVCVLHKGTHTCMFVHINLYSDKVCDKSLDCMVWMPIVKCQNNHEMISSKEYSVLQANIIITPYICIIMVTCCT